MIAIDQGGGKRREEVNALQCPRNDRGRAEIRSPAETKASLFAPTGPDRLSKPGWGQTILKVNWLHRTGYRQAPETGFAGTKASILRVADSVLFARRKGGRRRQGR
jgi:hypothetical protein